MQDADGDTRMSAAHYPANPSNLPPFANRLPSSGLYPGQDNSHSVSQSAMSPATMSGSANGSLYPSGSGSSYPHRSGGQSPSHSQSTGFPSQSTVASTNPTTNSVSGTPNSGPLTLAAAAASVAAAASGPQPTVYLATYSNVPVFEITVRGIAVMRRRIDGYLNATQILKVAGIEKAKRTKILEKEILTGEHEKVQGGYGKYQGTWIPLVRAQELAATHNVAHLLRAVLEFDPKTADTVPTAGPKKRPNPNAPSNSAPVKAQAGPASSSKITAAPASRAESQAVHSPSSYTRDSATPTKGPSQQPRFLQLRAVPEASSAHEDDTSYPPTISSQGYLAPGSASLLGALGSSSKGSSNDGIPPGSSSSMREALSGYSQYGYTPQGVPLPTPSKTKRSEPDAATSNSSEQPSKRARTAGVSPPVESASGAFAIGPSPVKDLAALAGPGSSLRGASHPRLHRVPLGPPDELVGKAGNARFADRPQPLKNQDEGEKRMRERLVALFMQEDGAKEPSSEYDTLDQSPPTQLEQLLLELRSAVSLGGNATAADEGGPVPCIDTIIDDHGHTALHWASALCRLKLVRNLVAKSPSSGGANVHAGNYAGETALHRSVLVTNAYDSSMFPELLTLLAPSLHTRDFKSRTVLHHIALVSALKGRATPARYYLACLLEFVSQKEGGRFAALVDAQDEDGETALGIAARQGNNSMVKMLLEVGARKDLANCLGLKPSDWGIDGGTSTEAEDGLSPQTKAGLKENRSDVVAALMRPPKAPLQKSQDVLEQMRSILDELSSTSNRELTEKTTALQTAQSHLQSATRELTSRRRMISDAQSKVAEIQERKIRISNLRRRLAREQGQPDGGDGRPAITQTQIDELLRLEGEDRVANADGQEESRLLRGLGDSDEVDALVLNRWLKTWYIDHNAKLEQDMDALGVEAQTREQQCRKVVAMYSRIEESKVEGILEDLVSAVENYSEVDLARVAGFLAKTVTSGPLKATKSPSAANVAAARPALEQ